MPIDALLLEMLACPSDDHAPLVEATRDGAPVLVCTFCQRERKSSVSSRAKRGSEPPFWTCADFSGPL